MKKSRVKPILLRIIRAPFMPVLMHIDRRFQALFQQLISLDKRMATLEAQISEQGQRVHCDTQSMLQGAAFVERAADGLTGTVTLMEQTQDELKEMIRAERGAQSASWANHLLAHDGPISEAGLWFNPPVVLNITAQGVELDQIHERIVEVPFVYRVLAGVPPGGHILDVGCAESTVAFSLAALGFHVLGLDQRDYPLAHPNLCSITEDLVKWSGPREGTLDAVVCLSSLEHFGLDAYESNCHDSRLDSWAMKQFIKWLKKGGRLALTVPYGRAAVGTFERVYGAAELDQLLEGWDVKERLVYMRHGNTEWRKVEASDAPWPAGVRGVVLVHAEKT